MENKMTEKFIPKIGDKLYLSQKTGNWYVDMVRKPYTVIAVDKSKITIQAAECIFPIFHYEGDNECGKKLNGQRVQFYDTLAEDIVENKNGRIEELIWHNKRGMWGTKGRDSNYPQYAFFGKYDYYPYLN